MRTNLGRACLCIGTAKVLYNIAVDLNDPHFEGDDTEMNKKHLILPNNELQQTLELLYENA